MAGKSKASASANGRRCHNGGFERAGFDYIAPTSSSPKIFLERGEDFAKGPLVTDPPALKCACAGLTVRLPLP